MSEQKDENQTVHDDTKQQIADVQHELDEESEGLAKEAGRIEENGISEG